ncbi:hypothetical protein HHO41_21480 [Bacillus sp. DNRA2]|uniref:hypothetical protein n=1 Tax=Bacillus sp. DNRA2 TaxID=2723053 RepID=UPI00145ECCF2|nr:hypothetical protein [Bacillus sp. DNRA2]NMD72797.1 hypothetical protein [Bacillus sp. DNRA2]
MSDKTFGVKVSEELHDKVKLMIENSGITSKEWFEKAVALTEIQELKTGAPDYKQDLSELEVHTTRIYELVANMIQRANYLKDDAVRGLSEKLESKDLTITDLQQTVKELKERVEQSEAAAKQSATETQELNEQLEGLRSMNATNLDLIQEYKDKIDTLSSLVNEYKGYATENTELKERHASEKESMTANFNQRESELSSVIEELKEANSGQQDKINGLTSALNNAKRDHEKEMKSLQDNQVNELTQLTITKNLEKERAVLEAERKFQEKLQEVHDQYNEKLARLYEKFEVTETKKTAAARQPKQK